jgi:NAD(P)-dependent dehydrogenase (short-subunit alcohol dehydrogenase family)
MPMRYGWETTTADLLDGRSLSGRRILVTGGTSGLGLETARAVAAHGADVVITARNAAKGERAASTIRATAAPGASVEVCELDLESLASVRACAERLLAGGVPLDLVFANAGVMACPEGRTREGFETQIGTNHIGHFVLANKLAPLVARSGSGRIVVTSSASHRISDVNLEDPNFERTPYDAWQAYGRSKTANVLYAVELDRRLKGRGVRACAIHPGAIHTELARHLTPETMSRIQQIIDAAGGREFRFKSIPQGAATQVWAGVVADAETVGGRYCENCGVAEKDDGQNPIGGVRSYALDPTRARALWTWTEDWVKERFPLGD